MSFLDEEKYCATSLERPADLGRPGERYVLALKPCTLSFRITDCTASE